jgi:hypothetical protein
MRIEKKLVVWTLPSGIEFVFSLLVSLFFLSQGFRLISIPFLLAWIYAYWSRRGRYSPKRALCASFIFFATLFVPIDIDVGGWYDRRGATPGGIHFVRNIPGMPMHTLLIEQYGEYISAGCCAGDFEPRWVLVWN